MLTTPEDTRTNLRLRDSAEIRIQSGIAPQTHGGAIGVAALTLLHRLASDPATAGDALKLLHELQVHQVEIDLQHERMEEDYRELQDVSDHFAELYAFAPVAYFTVDMAGRIIEGNLAAARLLGAERIDLEGRSIDRLVAPESEPSLRALLRQVQHSTFRHSCRARAGDGSGWLEVVAIAAPGGQHCRLIATGLTDASLPPSNHEKPSASD